MYLSLFCLIFLVNAMDSVTCDFRDYSSDVRDFSNYDLPQLEEKAIIVKFCEKEVDLKLIPGGDLVDPDHKIQTFSQTCDSFHMKRLTGNWSLVQVRANVDGVTQLIS
jgi:hypothetical protein